MLHREADCPTSQKPLQLPHISAEIHTTVYTYSAVDTIGDQDRKVGVAWTERMWRCWERVDRRLRDVFKKRKMLRCMEKTRTKKCGCDEGIYHWTPLCKNLMSTIRALGISFNHTHRAAQTLPKQARRWESWQPQTKAKIKGTLCGKHLFCRFMFVSNVCTLDR